MAPYETLYGYRCRTSSCWTELSEWRVLDPELVSTIEDKVRLIRDRQKAASDKQKYYADLKWKEIEFSMGDLVFLKVLPWKKTNEVEFRPDLTLEEEPVQIIDRAVKVLRGKTVPLVKGVIYDIGGSVLKGYKPILAGNP
ncbi:uncharacterized protein LOC108481420 [Gossypium arboreum]|uniref:uncharacterized protein LOC108481420 n=1 Tax=Gossypium arboreum TaxID=29729 RepID=UPI0008194496|nr:uncharacterized protein LOC108481420 [Gossypium arboreum]